VNKSELITAVAEKAGVRKSECESVVGAFLETVTSTLKTGADIRLVGFGTFSVADRKATVGRNPSTGQEIAIPASRVPKFKPGQGLKDAVNIKQA
jgi:DNA-binding protein HU-beta